MNWLKFRQHWVILGAGGVVCLVLIPLFGLVTGLIDPPHNPFVAQPPSFWQLLNYTGTFRLLITTLALALLVSVLASAMGTWFAWVEQRTRYPGGTWLGMLNLLPLAMPSYIVAVTLRESLGPGGMVGSGLGLPSFTGFFPAVLVLTLITVPYVQLLVAATLTRLSVTEEEAARCLGASKQRIFKHIVFPKLRPSFAFAWLISLLYVVSDFGAVVVLDTQVLTWRLYQAVEHQQLAQATVLGLFILAITVPVLFIARWIHGTIPHVSQVSNPRPAKRRLLRGWQLGLTYSLHGVVVGLGVGLPVLTLCVWVYQGWVNHLPFANLWQPMRDTLHITVPSTVGIILLAALPAWVVAYYRQSRCSMWLERGTYLTKSLPGILLAFGLILSALFFSRLFSHSAIVYQWLLGSGILLFLGYSMRFIAEAYAGLKSSMLLLDPRLSEVRRSLNANKRRYFAKVAMPTVLPGVTAASLLVWLALIKELPITLLLAGAMGLRPLSFRIFDRYQEAFLQDVGAAGLVLLIGSFCLVLITLRWRRHAS